MDSKNTSTDDYNYQPEALRLQAILDATSSAILEISNNGQILFANQAACHLFGYSKAEFSEMHICQLLPSISASQNEKQSFHHLLSETESFAASHKNGLEMFLGFEVQQTQQSSVIATISVTSHIQIAQSELDISNERLRMAKEVSQIGVWEYNVKTQQLIWDEQMFRLYGHDTQNYLGTVSEWTNALHPDDKEHAINTINHAILQKIKCDTTFRIITPGNEIRYMKAMGHPVLDDNNKVCKIIGVNYDQTENYIVQEELRTSLKENQFLAKVAEETINSVILMDENGKIAWVNKGFTRISGYQLDEVKGLSPNAFLHGKDTNPATVNEMLNSEINNYRRNHIKYRIRNRAEIIFINTRCIFSP